MAWIVNDTNVIGTVAFTAGRFHNRDVVGTFDLVKDFQEHRNGNGGFVTVRCKDEGREGRRMRVTVPGLGVGYTVLNYTEVSQGTQNNEAENEAERVQEEEVTNEVAQEEQTQNVLTFKEAAERLGVTVNALRKRAMRGTVDTTMVDGVKMVVVC